MASVLENVLESSLTLISSVSDMDKLTKEQLICEYLEQRIDSVSVGDFKVGLEWFNVKKPLSLEKDLRGKVVVLDFFTYCCINCLHILPKLQILEDQHSVKDGLVIIGVHSAKFDNEKDSKNIMSAVQRYGILHPVVNDAEGTMWSALGVPCWPTLLVLSPSGNPVFVAVGESNMLELQAVVDTAIGFYQRKGKLSTHEIQTSSLAHIQGHGPLLFPGKVSCCRKGDHLAIADTGHHRIIICSEQGEVQHIVGGTISGFCDGKFHDVRFRSPQGVAFLDCGTLYVADTDNNAIRKVDIASQQVSSVMANEATLGSKCPSSPWDLCLTPDDSCLLIAAAGCHRIWGLFLRDTLWWRKTQMHAGMCVPIAGNGREENRNNAYAHAAAFAQPSGVTVASALNAIFIADSESSSIRKIDLKDGGVSAVVGGGRNPSDLFCFGDVDGTQWDVRLQHPLGVVWCGNGHNNLYIVDSYNHKLKIIDPVKRSCHTVFGTGIPGDDVEAGKEQLNEPGGICSSPCGSRLYIADTNNNCIKVVYLCSEEKEKISVCKLNVQLPEKQIVPTKVDKKVCSKIHLSGGTVNWLVTFVLSDGLAYTNAPQKWHLQLPKESGWSAEPSQGEVSLNCIQLNVSVPSGDKHNEKTVFLEATLFLCNSSNMCQRNSMCFALCLEYNESAPRQVECSMSCDIAPHK